MIKRTFAFVAGISFGLLAAQKIRRGQLADAFW